MAFYGKNDRQVWGWFELWSGSLLYGWLKQWTGFKNCDQTFCWVQIVKVWRTILFRRKLISFVLYVRILVNLMQKSDFKNLEINQKNINCLMILLNISTGCQSAEYFIRIFKITTNKVFTIIIIFWQNGVFIEFFHEGNLKLFSKMHTKEKRSMEKRFFSVKLKIT